MGECIVPFLKENSKAFVYSAYQIHIDCSIEQCLISIQFYILGNEYKAPTTAFETELLNTVDKLDSSKKEQLLRIAKVL